MPGIPSPQPSKDVLKRLQSLPYYGYSAAGAKTNKEEFRWRETAKEECLNGLWIDIAPGLRFRAMRHLILAQVRV